MLARSAKVQSDLKQRFITLAWPETQKSAMSGMGFHMLWLRLSRGHARRDACRESSEGAPMRGWLVEPAVHHGGHGDPPRQGMELEEVTLLRRGDLGFFSNGPRQCIVERGARIFFLVEVDGAEFSLGAKSCLQKLLVEGDQG